MNVGVFREISGNSSIPDDNAKIVLFEMHRVCVNKYENLVNILNLSGGGLDTHDKLMLLTIHEKHRK